MIDTTAGTPSLPLAMVDFLVPGLVEADVTGVDDLTDAHLTEPMTPIRELHPKRRAEKQGYNEGAYLFNHFISLILTQIILLDQNHSGSVKLIPQKGKFSFSAWLCTFLCSLPVDGFLYMMTMTIYMHSA